eukprot:5802363-Karenia_brevis.AAC.1
MVQFTKVKGHAKARDVLDGVISQADRYGNHCADTLATSGAAQHAVSKEIAAKAKCRQMVAKSVRA